MSDGLDLKEVRVHPNSRTILCPHCGVEGKHYFLVGKWHDGVILPADCKECGETFVVHVTSDPNQEAPLRTLAMAIYQVSTSWDHRDVDLVSRVERHLDAVLAATPGMDRLRDKPVLVTQRNTEGAVEILPKNNAALRVMEILDEIRRRDTTISPQDMDGPPGLRGV